VNRRELFAGGATLLCLGTSSSMQASAGNRTRSPARDAFTPGETWLDTSGKPIQAHGGSIIEVDDTFYWYGENKEFTTGKTDVWTWGIRCYSSPDLYNWTDVGLIIPPDLREASRPLHPSQFIDRPHILYNEKTRKYVCWIKIMENRRQTRTVLVADAITGPYEVIRSGLQPLGMSAGDFDLVASPDDGKAYMYFERVHSEMICADLTDDYTDFTGYYSTHFPRPGPPAVREGPAYFRRRGKHYLATSGTTGYFPNPSEVAIADTFHGPFTTLGDLHPGDASRTSFNSQISCIFRHPAKKDLYIALADRWMGPLSGAEFESGTTSRLVRRAFAKQFNSPPQPLNADEARVFEKSGFLRINTSEARYVWLPIHFDDDRPVILWRPEWRIEDFE
jgi:hypothetical protein